MFPKLAGSDELPSRSRPQWAIDMTGHSRLAMWRNARDQEPTRQPIAGSSQPTAEKAGSGLALSGLGEADPGVASADADDLASQM
jgi:hypothetical protein